MDEYQVTVQLWDTAGQEKYRSVISSYYQQAHGIVLVYDISNRQTFEDLSNWLSIITEKCSKECKILLIGNKKDLNSQREVSEQEGKEFGETHEMFFMETSAKDNTDQSIERAFQSIIDFLGNIYIPKGLESWNKQNRVTYVPIHQQIKEKTCC